MSIFGERLYTDTRMTLKEGFPGEMPHFRKLRVGDVVTWGRGRFLVIVPGWTEIGVEPYRWWRRPILVARRWLLKKREE